MDQLEDGRGRSRDNLFHFKGRHNKFFPRKNPFIILVCLTFWQCVEFIFTCIFRSALAKDTIKRQKDTNKKGTSINKDKYAAFANVKIPGFSEILAPDRPADFIGVYYP
jgi:hypothetical protein